MPFFLFIFLWAFPPFLGHFRSDYLSSLSRFLSYVIFFLALLFPSRRFPPTPFPFVFPLSPIYLRIFLLRFSYRLMLFLVLFLCFSIFSLVHPSPPNLLFLYIFPSIFPFFRTTFLSIWLILTNIHTRALRRPTFILFLFCSVSLFVSLV